MYNMTTYFVGYITVSGMASERKLDRPRERILGGARKNSVLLLFNDIFAESYINDFCAIKILTIYCLRECISRDRRYRHDWSAAVFSR